MPQSPRMLKALLGSSKGSSFGAGENFNRNELHSWDQAISALIYSRALYWGTANINWLTSTAYVPGNVVMNGGLSYVCLVGHTSGTFANDLVASPPDWKLAQPTVCLIGDSWMSNQLWSTVFSRYFRRKYGDGGTGFCDARPGAKVAADEFVLTATGTWTTVTDIPVGSVALDIAPATSTVSASTLKFDTSAAGERLIFGFRGMHQGPVNKSSEAKSKGTKQ